MIKISHQETLIFDIIKNTIINYKLNVIPRVVGGWVRDKLLEINTNKDNDIDITVDTMSGIEFAKKIQTLYLKNNYKIVIIESNYNKCKHIGTCSIVINGVSLNHKNSK